MTERMFTFSSKTLVRESLPARETIFSSSFRIASILSRKGKKRCFRDALRVYLVSQPSFFVVNRTGIGLNLCKKLSQLMGGDIWLDESYDSGVEGFPGSRFVIDLATKPTAFDSSLLDAYEGELMEKGESLNQVSFRTEDSSLATASQEDLSVFELPDTLSVLFVDDDLILRKLFSRSVRRIAPGWDIQEAANGEAALHLTESKKFDLIFLVSPAELTTRRIV